MQVIDDFITMIKNAEFVEIHEVSKDDWKAFCKEGKKDEKLCFQIGKKEL